MDLLSERIFFEHICISIQIRDLKTTQSLPAYKEGEICVKGPQLMKGYFKNEIATSEIIIDGWLHTGINIIKYH